MHAAAALPSRHPARLRHDDPPVERDGRLVGDERTPGSNPRPPGLVLAAGQRGRLPGEELHLDPFLAQARETLAARLRVRVGRADDDLRDPGREDRVHAGRCAPVVGAGLESGIERRAPGLLAGHFEGGDLRVRPARLLVPAFPDDLVAGDDHRPDDGVWTGGAAPALGQLERALKRLRQKPSPAAGRRAGSPPGRRSRFRPRPVARRRA